MFRRVLERRPAIDICPVIDQDDTGKIKINVTQTVVPARDETTGRGEIFVLAANIYYRARRNTRARAAGIL